MGWARIDDQFHDHPKVDGLSLAAVGLWTLTLSWAHRHRAKAIIPGHVPQTRVDKVAGKHAKQLTDELVTAQLWEPEIGLGGYVIHDFADYCPKERDAAERREAGRKGAAKRWSADSKLPSEAVASDSSRADAPAPTSAFPSRPDPTTGKDLGGERPETLRAVPDTNPSNKPTCINHPNGNPKNEPCGGCAKVRERDEREAARLAERAAREAETAARNCVLCEGTHFVLDADKRPTRRKCLDHSSSVVGVTPPTKNVGVS